MSTRMPTLQLAIKHFLDITLESAEDLGHSLVYFDQSAIEALKAADVSAAQIYNAMNPLLLPLCDSYWSSFVDLWKLPRVTTASTGTGVLGILLKYDDSIASQGFCITSAGNSFWETLWDYLRYPNGNEIEVKGFIVAEFLPEQRHLIHLATRALNGFLNPIDLILDLPADDSCLSYDIARSEDLFDNIIAKAAHRAGWLPGPLQLSGVRSRREDIAILRQFNGTNRAKHRQFHSIFHLQSPSYCNKVNKVSTSREICIRKIQEHVPFVAVRIVQDCESGARSCILFQESTESDHKRIAVSFTTDILTFKEALAITDTGFQSPAYATRCKVKLSVWKNERSRLVWELLKKRAIERQTEETFPHDCIQQCSCCEDGVVVNHM